MPRLPEPSAQRYDTPVARKMGQFGDVRVQMPENPRIFGDSGCPKKAQIGRFGIGPLEEFGVLISFPSQPVSLSIHPRRALLPTNTPPWTTTATLRCRRARCPRPPSARFRARLRWATRLRLSLPLPLRFLSRWVMYTTALPASRVRNTLLTLHLCPSSLNNLVSR